MVINKKRTRMVRSYPTHTLEDALSIAKAIQESNAGLPFDRKLLAKALGTTPASSTYTMKLNSSAKYGLTQGGYNDERISLTSRGQAIAAPKDESELRRAFVDAAMQPDVFGKFYGMLDGKQLPEDTYAQNLLQRELGVHQDLTDECLGIIKVNGLYVGIIADTGDSLEVNLPGPKEPAFQKEGIEPDRIPLSSGHASQISSEQRRPGKVFIGHSGDSNMALTLESVLDSFGIPYVIVDSGEQDAGLISPQISADMKECTAAVLVVTDRTRDTSESRRIPKMDTMIYQLGAASVLYGNRILILKDRDVELNFDTGGVRCAEFDGSEIGQDALAILKELCLAGVIKVTA